MGKIKKMDYQLANLIAAGEVVERPSGIVKELVENAIDANATRINVFLRGGGINGIVVSDNGCGMSKDDIVLAFERHATSKILNTSDLFSIKTLGFRGEALPSIASVSKVIINTSDKFDSSKLIINYGEVSEVISEASDVGTKIDVSGLFFKTPARLKHLKSIAYESARVSDIIQKFALSNPDIAFSLRSDDKDIFKTSGNNDLIEVIYQVYGKDCAKGTVKFKAANSDYELDCICVLPQYTKSNRNAMNVFINGRMIKPYRIYKAIDKAYSKYIMSGRYPIIVLNIKMDSKLIDVNVHPSKWEVRLSKEMELEYFIQEQLEKALREAMSAPSVKLDRVIKEKVEINTFFDNDLNVMEEKTPYINNDISFNSLKDVDDITEEVTEKEVIKFPNLRLIGQLHGKYIICEGSDGLYLIDQHAAMERVNFEKFRDEMFKNNNLMQDVLIPYEIKTSNDTTLRINELNLWVKEFNIAFEVFSMDSLIVREIPIWMKDIHVENFLSDVVDSFKSEDKMSMDDAQKDHLASMACHHSIKFNRILSNDEMMEVIEKLSKCNQPYNCPHGRPTLICLDGNKLEREFLR
ncbi:MAG: DNA mismatch repair endonuclease MutL [Anaerorhabdus sp.]